MRGLILKNKKHIAQETAFTKWLELLGYSDTTVYSMPGHVREFLHWIEKKEKKIETLSSPDIQEYFDYLRERKKKKQQGALQASYLHKHLQAIKRFSHYLRKTTGRGFETDIVLKSQKRKLKALVSEEEIKELYAMCEDTALGLRDRAMLAVYYGSGLRRNEGRHLDLTDLLSTQNLLYVRKGKNYKERYVPITSEVRQEIENYITYGRVAQIKDPLETALFLSERGNRLQGQSLQVRLKQLLKKARIDKGIGLHTLRHSIATHLLSSGMNLAHISRFLGHESLESTQIYTQATQD